jgi:hypothetical protein
MALDKWNLNKAALDALLNLTGASENTNQFDW